MAHPDTQFTEITTNTGRSRRIAYEATTGQDGKPGLFWLSGFKSNMRSLKVTELAEWAAKQDVSMCRFDYSGHGESDGAFEDGTISDWLEEALHVFETRTEGPQILIGSSMGGWISLLMMRHLQKAGGSRIAGALLIAPAWDMTEVLMWNRFPDDVKKQVIDTGRFERPSAYDDGPYVITHKLIEDGRKHLISQERADFDFPIRIIHGIQDPDVPVDHSRDLLELLGEDVVLTLIKDGEHRLSRPKDLRRLICETELLLADLTKVDNPSSN